MLYYIYEIANNFLKLKFKIKTNYFVTSSNITNINLMKYHILNDL